MRWISMVVFLGAIIGCSGRVAAIDAGQQGDGGPADAAPAAPPGQVMDVTSASGHMTGGTYTLDFQVGHATDQGRSTNGTMTMEGGAAVKP